MEKKRAETNADNGTAKSMVDLDTVVKTKSGKKTMSVKVEILQEGSEKFGFKYRYQIKFSNGTTATNSYMDKGVEKPLYIGLDELNYIRTLKRKTFDGEIYEGETNGMKWVYCEVDLLNDIKSNFFVKGIGKKLYMNLRSK